MPSVRSSRHTSSVRSTRHPSQAQKERKADSMDHLNLLPSPGSPSQSKTGSRPGHGHQRRGRKMRQIARWAENVSERSAASEALHLPLGPKPHTRPIEKRPDHAAPNHSVEPSGRSIPQRPLHPLPQRPAVQRPIQPILRRPVPPLPQRPVVHRPVLPLPNRVARIRPFVMPMSVDSSNDTMSVDTTSSLYTMSVDSSSSSTMSIDPGSSRMSTSSDETIRPMYDDVRFRGRRTNGRAGMVAEHNLELMIQHMYHIADLAASTIKHLRHN